MKFACFDWLYLAPAIFLVLIGLLYVSHKRRKFALSCFASKKLLGQLLESYSLTKQRIKYFLLLTGILLVCIALARPQWGHEKESHSKGIDVIFAIDCSQSMLAQDIKPNRLSRAKLAIQDFIKTLEGSRLGLIAFAGNAFLQCPLTLDHGAFLQTLESINTETIPQGGTDIAAAIREAQVSFAQGKNFKTLILVTDGEDLEQEGLIESAKAGAKGIVIYTVGIGSSKGDLIPILSKDGGIEFLKDAEGKIVKTVLDEQTLTKIAEKAKGVYVPLGNKGEGFFTLYEHFLQKIPKQELSSHMEQIPIERFQYILALAILCLSLEPLFTTRKTFLKKKQ